MNADAIQRDSARKIAINAMYYNLEEVYYAKNNYYPTSIDSKILRAMDPGLFTDPTGTSLGELGANYTYDGANCTPDGKCSGYTLRSIMVREADDANKNRRTKEGESSCRPYFPTGRPFLKSSTASVRLGAASFGACT